jgi:hypothetical protein
VYKNVQVETLRAILTELFDNYVREAKIAVAKNVALGMNVKGIRAMREDDKTKWAARRAVLLRDIKREVAGAVNRVYHTTTRASS